MSDELIFSIKRDSNGQDIKFDAIPVDAVNSLREILESMTTLAEQTANGEKFTIKLEQGSLMVKGNLTSSHINRIKSNIDAVLENTCENDKIVNSCKKLQKLVKANGLVYDFNVMSNYNSFDLSSTLKEIKNLKPVTKRITSVTRTRFIVGELINAGGVEPNLNVKVVDGDKHVTMVVYCTEEQAKKAVKFLYSKIYFSCWSEYDFSQQKFSDNKGDFCDLYTEDNYNEYEGLFSTFFNKNEIEGQEYLHKQIRNMLLHEKWGLVAKSLRLFNHEQISPAIMRTLLVITKSFKDHNDIKEVRESIKNKLEDKIGKIV